jgi:hypothetical protein
MSYFPLGSAAGAWTAIETVTVSSDATVDMDLSGTHKMYQVHIDNLIPATNQVSLLLRFSVDAGSTFLEGASDYAWSYIGGTSTSAAQSGDVADTDITFSASLPSSIFGLGNVAEESYNGFINIHNANQTTKAVCVSGQVAMLDQTPLIGGFIENGSLIANINEVDAIRFLASSGNLTSGRITLYGLNLS